MAYAGRFLMAGVMGWPVMHSKSPMLHNYWFKQYGLNGTYVPFAIEPSGLGAALRALHPLGFAGCNLTIPHKQEALKFVDEVDPVGRSMGAISCVVVRPDGSLRGSNNDGYGFIENILEHAPQTRFDAGPIAVIGAGGGARAVIWGLAERGAKEIRLVNRTKARAQQIADEFNVSIKPVDWADRNLALEDCSMVVNTTSQGMVGMAPLDIDLARLPRYALVTDIVYTPLETPLLKAARLRGNPTVDGLGMLLHQARPAWQAWFNLDPKVTPELREMIEATL
jgi:shikimate dehydrogenase